MEKAGTADGESDGGGGGDSSERSGKGKVRRVVIPPGHANGSSRGVRLKTRRSSSFDKYNAGDHFSSGRAMSIPRDKRIRIIPRLEANSGGRRREREEELSRDMDRSSFQGKRIPHVPEVAEDKSFSGDGEHLQQGADGA